MQYFLTTPEETFTDSTLWGLADQLAEQQENGSYPIISEVWEEEDEAYSPYEYWDGVPVFELPEELEEGRVREFAAWSLDLDLEDIKLTAVSNEPVEELPAMTGAEFEAIRHLLGMSIDHVSLELDVTSRTVRYWGSEHSRVPLGVVQELWDMVQELTTEAKRVAKECESGEPYRLQRGDRGDLALAALVLLQNPNARFTWG